MIQLNILRDRLERFRKKRLIANLFIVYFGVLFFIILMLSMTFLGNKMQETRVKSGIRTIESRMDEERDIVNHVASKGQEAENLLKSLSFFMSENNKRILWTDKLYFIGNNVPYGVRLSRLSSATEGTGRRAVKVIEVHGYVIPELINERAAIDALINNLNNRDIFSAVYLKEVRKTVIERREVTGFSLVCELSGRRTD